MGESSVFEYQAMEIPAYAARRKNMRQRRKMSTASGKSGATSDDHISGHLLCPPPKQGRASVGDIFTEIKAKGTPDLVKTMNPQTDDKFQG